LPIYETADNKVAYNKSCFYIGRERKTRKWRRKELGDGEERMGDEVAERPEKNWEKRKRNVRTKSYRRTVEGEKKQKETGPKEN
jgi:hypothetical protein